MRARNTRAAALVSLLVSLVILSILMLLILNAQMGAMGALTGGGGVSPLQRLEMTRNTVCEANRRTLQVELMAVDAMSGGRPSFEDMRRLSQRLRGCPGEGGYYGLDDEVYCTQHTPTKKFSDRL